MASQVILFITSGTTFTAPYDWPGTADKIECIGGGGAGMPSNATSAEGTAGGGGAYAWITNQALANGASIQVGQGGATQGANGTATWVISTSTVFATFGLGGTASASGHGGFNTDCVPTNQAFHGGDGGAFSNQGHGGNGGGAAAGPNGSGRVGGSGSTNQGGAGGGGGGGPSGSAGSTGSGSNGGAGGNRFDGTGGGAGGTSSSPSGANGVNGGGGGGAFSGLGLTGTSGNGGNGADWISTLGQIAGAGGGGAGGQNGVDTAVGNGGLYGGGGGGSGQSTFTHFGTGANGIIVITYTPVETLTGQACL